MESILKPENIFQNNALSETQVNFSYSKRIIAQDMITLYLINEQQFKFPLGNDAKNRFINK